MRIKNSDVPHSAIVCTQLQHCSPTHLFINTHTVLSSASFSDTCIPGSNKQLLSAQQLTMSFTRTARLSAHSLQHSSPTQLHQCPKVYNIVQPHSYSNVPKFATFFTHTATSMSQSLQHCSSTQLQQCPKVCNILHPHSYINVPKFTTLFIHTATSMSQSLQHCSSSQLYVSHTILRWPYMVDRMLIFKNYVSQSATVCTLCTASFIYASASMFKRLSFIFCTKSSLVFSCNYL